jgi:hypothetical protein
MDRVYSSKDFDSPGDMRNAESRMQTGRSILSPNGKSALDEITEKSELEEKKEAKRLKKLQKEKQRKLIKFLCVNLGIFIMVILYAAGGAFLFQLLEQYQEIQNCQQGSSQTTSTIQSYRSSFLNYILFNITTNPWLDNSSLVNSDGYLLDPPSVYNPKITSMLKDMRDELLKYNTIPYRYYGQDCNAQSLWQFSSAFLFTMTVVSTIGEHFYSFKLN